MSNTVKKWWASKTIWVNIIAFITSILAALNIVDIDAEMQASLVGGIMAVTNIILRLTTKSGIKK